MDSSGASVVLMTDDVGVEDTGGGVKGIDGGVNAQLSDTAGQHSSGVQMGEGCGRSRVSQIVGRHVNGLSWREWGDMDTLHVVSNCHNFLDIY